ncbi:MAG: phosphohistidine phosphatase SixA [Methylophagaceae bacterium]
MIYFSQHGAALNKDIDKQRPLSDIGVNETHHVASKLKDKNIVISKIFHSGKLRALQTATIFSEVLNVSTVAELSGMSPNDDPNTLLEQLSDDNVMYVGHLPHIQKVVSTLVTANEDADVINFKNSAVACIQITGNTANLNWFISPDSC